MAQIALVGASGNAGARILKELSDRGHRVTAIARHPEKIAELAGCRAVKGDAHDESSLADRLKGHDAVISAVPFSTSDADTLIGAVQASGVKRYLVVGGAGSLLVTSGERVIDQPDFPEEYKPEASKGAVFLEKLQQADELEWTFLSPSAEFEPGERTGVFRLGKDELLVNDQGSRISFEDYAIALVDELEKPQHVRERFTVGY
ncbi:NAD(P)-dependent oxidoreductase [Halomonas sp. AOP35-4E-18]|uniref:NAD(P)-dependent oxidoreductase n=1 Tax=Halomonas sp. AOP35-4E-18 TaxID=3457686 RepID=UPI00403323E9